LLGQKTRGGKKEAKKKMEGKTMRERPSEWRAKASQDEPERERDRDRSRKKGGEKESERRTQGEWVERKTDGRRGRGGEGERRTTHSGCAVSNL